MSAKRLIFEHFYKKKCEKSAFLHHLIIEKVSERVCLN